MNVNRNYNALAETLKTLIDKDASWGAKFRATTFALNLGTSQVFAAAVTLAMRKWVLGGGTVLAGTLASGEGIYDYLVDASIYAFLGGPVQATVNMTRDNDRSVAETFANQFVPVSTAQEFVDWPPATAVTRACRLWKVLPTSCIAVLRARKPWPTWSASSG